MFKRSNERPFAWSALYLISMLSLYCINSLHETREEKNRLREVFTEFLAKLETSLRSMTGVSLTKITSPTLWDCRLDGNSAPVGLSRHYDDINDLM